MSHRILKGQQILLRIFFSELDKIQHRSLQQALVEQAHSMGLAGCTVLRAFEGYDFSLEGGARPLVMECVDTQERINSFLEHSTTMLAGTMVTEEKVLVRHYASDSEGETAPAKEITMKARETAKLKGKQTLLRIFIGEADKAGHKALHTAIVEEARKLGLAGCTAIRGILGFGATSVIHEDQLFRLSSDLPVVVEIVDTEERVHKLLKVVRPMLAGALVTEEKVTVHHYAASP